MISWAEILIAALERLPRLTVVAVEAMPVLVVSVLVQPVVFPVLIAVELAIPAMVKVRVGSTVACTWIDELVPILIFAVSRSMLLVTSVVVIVSAQESAVPAAAVLVGLIMVGT